MLKKKTRPSSTRVAIESLETRCLLSTSVATTTTVSAPSSTLLGQTFRVYVTVKDAVGDVVTGATVNLLNNGTETGLSAPLNSAGVATFVFGPGNALYTGSYALSGQFQGIGDDAPSTSAASNLTINPPTYTIEGDGLEVATVTPGSGAPAVNGQSLTVEYTGFYQSNGSEFDESSAHVPATLTYTLNADPEQVIPGFDQGTTGIEPGETRDVVIPSALGYQDGQVRIFVIQSFVAAGPAMQLSLAGAPTIATVDVATPIVVNVFDANDNQVTIDSSTVTLAIASGPAGATLGGTTTIAAQQGEASFNDLTFSEPGTYTLTATDGSLTAAISAPITVSATPSTVVPTLGKVSLASSVVAGGNLSAKLAIVVTNSGSAIKGEVTVKIYANMGTTLDGNQVQLASASANLSLKAQAKHAFNFDIKALPATLPNGTYHLLAEVIDPSGATSVTATSQTVTVAAAFVQPTISLGSVSPSTIAAGKFGSLTVTVTNAGNVAADSLDITVTPSADGSTQLAGIILDHIHSAAKLAPGKSKTFKLRFEVPSALTAGAYFPYVAATLGSVSASRVGTVTFTAA